MNDLLPLAVSAIAVLLTFLYASWQDIKTRTVATATWYPAAVVGGVVVLYFWYLQFQHPTTTAISVLALSVVICILMWGCAKAGLFGLADAKAMILLAATVPVNPFAAWLFPSLALSTLVNAGVIALLVPAALLIRNTIRKEHAPFWLMWNTPRSGSCVPACRWQVTRLPGTSVLLQKRSPTGIRSPADFFRLQVQFVP